MSKLGYECCLCGRIFDDWGNNPYPLVDDEDARCCDDCNNTKVLPARLASLYANRKEKK